MTPKQNLPPRDLESLSAYIDGELPPKDFARLEARLSEEPALREALQGLRATVAALRSVEAVKPRRSFTLTPDMAGQGAPRRSTSPWLQLGTALAALTFVLVVGLDAFSRAGGPALAPAPSEFALQAQAPEDEALQESTPTEESDFLRAAPIGTPAPAGGALAPTATPERETATTAAPALEEPLAGKRAFRPSLPPIRTAEILLGLTFLGFAALTLAARRQG